MAIKSSLEANKSFILDSLPTQELKDEFLKSLENAPEELEKPKIEDQIKEAQAPDYVGEDLYSKIEEELKNAKPIPKMAEDEEKAAIEEALKNAPKA